MNIIRVMLIDDHQVVREGLRRMLELEKDFQVVGEATDASEALGMVGTLVPEVVLMDIKMSGVDGIELTRQVKQVQPNCNIIMLTLYDEYLPQAIEAGADGYLLKDIKREDLVKAIRIVHEGRSPLVLSTSRERLANLIPQLGEDALLSKRELEILRLIADGVTNKEISEQLFLSEATVKRSVRLIFEKIGVRNRSEAVAEAYKRKLF